MPCHFGSSLSCTFLKDKIAKSGDQAPAIDFEKPAEPLNVKVELHKKQTASGRVLPSGGSVSLNQRGDYAHAVE